MPSNMYNPPSQQMMYSPAMQEMAEISGIQIKEKVRAVEALTAMLGQEIEMANKYVIQDLDTKRNLFTAVEQTDCFTMQLKQCCGDCAAWKVDILRGEQPVFKLERDWTLTCCCLNRPVLIVTDSTTGHEIGSIVDPFTCCNLKFNVDDEHGEEVVLVNGGCCQLGLCCPLPCGPCAKVQFDITSPNGGMVGQITKKVPGFLKFLVAPDVDNFEIDFGRVQDPKHKVLIMALAIFMDFKYFSTNDNAERMEDVTGGY
mmetsp:Transcript_32087/g.51669  ORF Transcript_32087/g.51669 Transcript_32087/m.51669 type:complete len:257 (+) Transcript_32087:53-823(+)